MSHTTKMTILDKYYNQNQSPLKTLDKTAKVPHMAARGAGWPRYSLDGKTVMAACLCLNFWQKDCGQGTDFFVPQKKSDPQNTDYVMFQTLFNIKALK